MYKDLPRHTPIAVLLSGGVDSSLALRLLVEAGFTNVTAFYIKIWLEEELAFLGDCPWETDIQYARAVCEQVNVPLEIVPLQREYYDRVVQYALRELKAGRTPSPDIFCNEQIKFGAFLEKIDPRFQKVASGHYARIEFRDGKYWLKRAPDPVKDQTYFLSYLTQEQLARILFPVGEYTKRQVRELAHRFNLPTKDRPDSQGICFLGKIKYADFVKAHFGEKPGDIVEMESGKKLGTHRGFWFYTIGQRQGLGLSNGPWYVVGKNAQKNIIYVSHRQNILHYYRRHIVVEDVNWISGMPEKRELQVKLRHGPGMQPATIEPLADGRVMVHLAAGDKGAAPGQFTIFYDGDYCLGGGKIAEFADAPEAVRLNNTEETSQ